MVLSVRIAAGVLLFAAGALQPASAQTEPGSEPSEPVRLYTNSDLLRFGSPSTEPRPVSTDNDEDWDSVAAFLEREQARLDAERAYELERRRVSYEERRVDREPRSSYVYSFHGIHGFHALGHDHRRGMRGGLRGSIAPLHARPSLAQEQRAKAMQHSGVDAFPSNARRRD